MVKILKFVNFDLRLIKLTKKARNQAIAQRKLSSTMILVSI